MCHLICPSLFVIEHSHELFIPPSQRTQSQLSLIAAKLRPLVVSMEAGKAVELWRKGEDSSFGVFIWALSTYEYIATVNSTSFVTLVLEGNAMKYARFTKT